MSHELALRIKGMWETVSEREGKPTKLILSFRMVSSSFDIFKKALKELEADGFKVKETLTGDFLIMKGETANETRDHELFDVVCKSDRDGL